MSRADAIKPRTTREHGRALKARALANETDAQLESFEGDPQTIPADAARWEQLLRLKKQRDTAADRAEQRDKERPVLKKREKHKRERDRARVQKSGTRLETGEAGSTIRRVTACCNRVCGRVVGLVAPEQLWAAGWGSHWALGPHAVPRRLFTCPDCWTPPVLKKTPPTYQLPPAMAAAARLRCDSKAHKALDKILRRLEEIDTPRAHAFAAQIAGQRAELLAARKLEKERRAFQARAFAWLSTPRPADFHLDPQLIFGAVTP